MHEAAATKSVSVDEAAFLLQLNPAEIRWLVDTGQLPARERDRQLLVTLKDLDRLIRSYKSVSTRRTGAWPATLRN